MSKFSTLYQSCFYFCLAITIATLFINFVDGLDLFGNANIEIGADIGNNATNAFTQITGLTGGFEYFWGLAVGVGLAVTSVIAYATQSTTPIGVYLFGTLFWTSYTRLLSITGGFIPDSFELGVTVALMLLFAGAVVGMLSGGG